ncbi:Hcp family type VI secretion system effector [Massilia horti]|uniref:Type VI secretion system tube protein Hcp n=1 Tax=Massilia horti TaxID=2562153 RepID=A0A4Y9T0J8_9BURK|nr:type VI secretion system tube protein Hcp [Massilia horti]TFW31018.1 type VI secretion system tube protein Hcp [Massilia horti]
MAIDAYLKLGEIKGESADEVHRGWIECTSVNWTINQPKSTTTSTSGGHTAGRAELSDVTFHKLADLASPILAQHCAMGKTIPKAKLEFYRADGDGKRVKYYEVELENVLVSHVAQGVNDGGMTENIGLKFSKVKWTYTQQRISGGVGGSTVGGWDLASNRVV